MISKYPQVHVVPVHGGFSVYILGEQFVFPSKEKCGDAIRAFMLNPKKFFEDYGLKFVYPPLAPSAGMGIEAGHAAESTAINVPAKAAAIAKKAVQRKKETKVAVPASAPPLDHAPNTAESAKPSGADAGSGDASEWK